MNSNCGSPLSWAIFKRSCINARNGASPVPEAIIMTGILRLRGKLKLLVWMATGIFKCLWVSAVCKDFNQLVASPLNIRPEYRNNKTMIPEMIILIHHEKLEIFLLCYNIPNIRKTNIWIKFWKIIHFTYQKVNGK